MNTTEALFRHVCEHPTDHAAKLVLADAYNDAGEYELAEVWSWFGVWELHPASDGKGWFDTCNERFVSRSPGLSSRLPGRGQGCFLPRCLFDRLPLKHQILSQSNFTTKEYWQVAVHAFLKQKETGWEPPWPHEVTVMEARQP